MHAQNETLAAPADSPLARRLHDAARIAGRLAHDFDNMLMGVMGFAELAQRVTASDSPAHQHQASVLKVARQGQEMTKRLHDFSRCGQVANRPTDPAVVWRTAWSKWGIDRPDVRAFERGLADLPLVALGPEPWARVLTELTRNALEAMPEGGEMTIEAGIFVAIGPFATFGPVELPAGRYVRWSVADTGAGLKAGVLRKLECDLIATTKTRHRGLGLPIALRTLIVHGGGLRLDPALPRGVAAVVYLPIAADAVDA